MSIPSPRRTLECMNRLATASVAALLSALTYGVAPAQTAHDGGTVAPKKQAALPSTTLTVTGLSKGKAFTVAELSRLPRTTVTVTNAHSGRQEIYTGVTVKDLLALVAPARIVPVTGADVPAPTKASTRMMVVIAHGTDNFRVALTLCDTDPACRSGQAIVADSVDGHPLTTDGAFKLILTEDKTPGRWVRNLDALTVRDLADL